MKVLVLLLAVCTYWANSQCAVDGDCINGVCVAPTCDCTGTGYIGNLCEAKECAVDADCAIGSACDPISLICICTDTGYTGDLCDIDIDECATGNGGCEQTCNNTIGAFSCSCNAGYNANGLACEDIDECATDIDLCDHTCNNTAGSYVCACAAGYGINDNGVTCNDVNECAVDISGCDHTCSNNIGSFICSCNDGYTLNADGRQCDVSDICIALTPCLNNATCQLNGSPEGYNCSCYGGYIGPICQTCKHSCFDGYKVDGLCDGCDINDTCIADMPCQNGGECTLTTPPDEYDCTCIGYFTGTNCEVCSLSCANGEVVDDNCDGCALVNICERDSPCDNGGLCSLNGAPDQYNCGCTNSYTGQNCSECGYNLCTDGYMVKSGCDGCDLNNICIANSPCQHGGTCTLTTPPDQYSCACTGNFGGKNCDAIVTCPSETDTAWNIYWPDTGDGDTATVTCPSGTGVARRACNGEVWLGVDVSNCSTSQIFSTINDKVVVDYDPLNGTVVEVIAIGALNLTEELAVVTMPTGTSLYPTELAATNTFISYTITALNGSFIANNETAGNIDPIVDTLSNILDLSNTAGWNSVQDTNPSMGGELLLQNAENLGLYLASTLAGNDTESFVSRSNIVFSALNFVVEQETVFPNISFPEVNHLANFTNHGIANITIPGDLLMKRSVGRDDVSVVSVLFNNLQELLNSSSRSTMEPGSLIISSQVAVARGDDTLTTPVTIDFEIIVENFSKPTCVFWNIVGERGWSNEGIETVYNDGATSATCLSSHLTSFAVLVDVAGVVPPTNEALALSIVTYIGLVISVVCLVLTIIFFLTFGKQLFTRVHYFVHLNFALCLLLAYIVFAAGIETATGNKVACTFVAALLHYFFLSAFCWMLCEGIMLYLMLVVVFSSLSKKWWFFLIIGWGATSRFYADGEDFCWLSVRRHVIWSFIVPMLIIILINTSFLVAAVCTIYKSKKTAQKLKSEKRFDLALSLIKASVILLPLLGLTWVFGLLAVNQQTTVFAWIFTIMNTLQGAAIFFLHVIRNDKIWKVLVDKCRCLSFISHHKAKTYSITSQTKGNTSSTIKSIDKQNIVTDNYELASVNESMINQSPSFLQSEIDNEKSDLRKVLDEEYQAASEYQCTETPCACSKLNKSDDVDCTTAQVENKTKENSEED